MEFHDSLSTPCIFFENGAGCVLSRILPQHGSGAREYVPKDPRTREGGGAPPAIPSRDARLGVVPGGLLKNLVAQQYCVVTLSRTFRWPTIFFLMTTGQSRRRPQRDLTRCRHPAPWYLYVGIQGSKRIGYLTCLAELSSGCRFQSCTCRLAKYPSCLGGLKNNRNWRMRHTHCAMRRLRLVFDLTFTNVNQTQWATS